MKRLLSFTGCVMVAGGGMIFFHTLPFWLFKVIGSLSVVFVGLALMLAAEEVHQ